MVNERASTRYLWLISIIAAWGGVLFGYDAVVMSGTIPIVLKQFSFSSFQLGFLVSSVLWGCVIGSFISGILVDRVGRKPLLILAAVIILASALFTSISQTIPQLIGFRLIGGLGGGMVTTICPLYISEIAPAEKRGRLVSLYHFSVCLGIVICVFVNWAIYSYTNTHSTLLNDFLQRFIIDQYWRLMFFSEVIPAVLFMIGVCIIPETPRWLIYHNQETTARNVLIRINSQDKVPYIEQEIRMSFEAGKTSRYSDVFSKKYIRPLGIAIALCALSEACGISAVLYYGPQLLEQSGISLGQSLGGFSIIALVNLIFNIIAVRFMDSIGRRKLLGIGTTGCMISLILIGLFFSLNSIGLLMVLPFISFIAFFGFSVGPVKFIIISEIFPLQDRGKAVSLSTLVIWITSAVIAQLFPVLREVMTTSYVFYLFAIDLALLLLLNVLFLKETKGKSIEAVYETWFNPNQGKNIMNTGEHIQQLESEIIALKEELRQLKQSEHLFEALFEQAGGYSMILDPHTDDGIPIIIDANQAACEYHGYEKDDFIGKPVAIVDDEEGKRKVKQHTEMIMTGKPFHIENKHMRKDGSIFHVSVNAQRIDLPEGPSVILTTEYDITERVLAKQALNKSEQRFRMAINELPFPAMIHDNTGRVYFINQRWTELTGYTYEDIDTIQKWASLAYKENQYSALEVIDTIFQYHDLKNISKEYEIHTKDERSVYWQFYTSLVSKNQDGTIIILSTAIDRTEVKRLQKELNQSEKLNAIGQLAGGIAHDFNNMLGVIIGYSEMALLEVDKDCGVHGNLSEILRAAEHSAALTKQLLAFARKQPISPTMVNLNDFVSKYSDLYKKLIGEQIELNLDMIENPPLVYIDETQLTQILTNLCVNARDAMQHSAKRLLIIKTSKRLIVDSFKHICPDSIPGDFMVLSIKDSGCGMDSETLNRMAEPFFTTKDITKGTGMGFSTVYGIVKQNKGFTHIDSGLGRGTTIEVYLPIAKGVIPESTNSKITFDKDNAQWTILFVEDESALLSLGKRMLEEFGYHVIACSSAKEALTIVKNQQDSIDLLITDVILPDMNGYELTLEIKGTAPRIKYLYMSGYTADIMESQGISEMGKAFIQKPFTAATLIRKINEVLYD